MGKKFAPAPGTTPAKVAAALTGSVNLVLMATVVHDLEKGRCEAIQRRVLAEQRYVCRDIYDPAGPKDWRCVEPADAWHLIEGDSQRYYDRLHEAYVAAGYTDLERGYCPALIAEQHVRDARRLLVEEAERFFPGMTFDAILCCERGLEKLDEYIDLLIKLTVNTRGYKPPKLPGVA